MIATDIRRLSASTASTNRLLGIDEASSLAGYTRVLLAVAKERKPLHDQSKNLDELLDEAMSIPALREALMKAGSRDG